jgi:hypothetical protein
MGILNWIIEVGYSIGYVTGIVVGVGLIVYNRCFNTNQTDGDRMIGAIIGAFLLIPCLRNILGGEEILFFSEVIYFLGGIYLLRECAMSFGSVSQTFRNIAVCLGLLILFVPLKLAINLFLIWRVVEV